MRNHPPKSYTGDDTSRHCTWDGVIGTIHCSVTTFQSIQKLSVRGAWIPSLFFLSAIKYFNLLTALILKCGGRNLNEDYRQFTSSSLYQVFIIWSHFYTGCMMTKIKTSHSFFKLKLTYSFSLLCFSSASASRALACCSLASVSFCCRSRRLLIFSKLCRDKQSQPQTVAFFIHPSADSFVDE